MKHLRILFLNKRFSTFLSFLLAPSYIFLSSFFSVWLLASLFLHLISKALMSFQRYLISRVFFHGLLFTEKGDAASSKKRSIPASRRLLLRKSSCVYVSVSKRERERERERKRRFVLRRVLQETPRGPCIFTVIHQTLKESASVVSRVLSGLECV